MDLFSRRKLGMSVGSAFVATGVTILVPRRADAFGGLIMMAGFVLFASLAKFLLDGATPEERSRRRQERRGHFAWLEEQRRNRREARRTLRAQRSMRGVEGSIVTVDLDERAYEIRGPELVGGIDEPTALSVAALWDSQKHLLIPKGPNFECQHGNRWEPRIQPATEPRRKEAREFLASLADDVGTELNEKVSPDFLSVRDLPYFVNFKQA